MAFVDKNATAILHFDSRENAETAKTAMHGKQFQNRLLRIEWVKPGKKDTLKGSIDDAEIASELDSALERDGQHNGVAVAPRLGERPLSFHSIHVQFEAVPVSIVLKALLAFVVLEFNDLLQGIMVNNTHLQRIFSAYGDVTDVYIKNSAIDEVFTQSEQA